MDSSLSILKQRVPLAYGAAVVASTAIGVGMMSLPLVSLGMWFFLSLVVLTVTAFYVIATGSLLLEVNMKYPIGTGIHSMVRDLLGCKHALICDFMMIFNGFILLYAYITVGTEAVQFYLREYGGYELNWYLAGVLFAGVFGAIFYTIPITISRFLSAFMLLMSLSFVYIVYELSFSVALNNIVEPAVEHHYSLSLLPFVLMTLPFFMAAMGYQQVIPMLRRLYNDKPRRVIRSVAFGVGFVSLIYLVWLLVIMGNQPRETMILSVSEGKDNIENVVETISQSDDIKSLMFFFVQMAVLTSFIGVAKGLLDYLMDVLSNHYKLSTRYAKVVVLLLPLTLSLTFPYGFLMAIGFAGLAGAIWAGVYPALMALVSRKNTRQKEEASNGYVTLGGEFTPWLILAYSMLLILTMLLGLFDLLPKF
ncbi:aromatic amino acid transport family protein [Vibrio sp. CB1-14]|uniref:Aromatic amino acid transport family protein n=1 Tax=Vibrio chaetopteri TaxID=3016528 RepID=A0AAU8BRC4_9VIBR